MNFEDKDKEFDEEYDEEFDEEFDEDLDETLDEEFEEERSDEIKKPVPNDLTIKTPTSTAHHQAKKISVYLMSTIGPGEKKQKLLIYTGYKVGDIKETVGNIFGLDPADFHLSTGGVTMEEGLTLDDYNVNDGDDILLIPASTAG
ncbi:MAG: ubiquitin family protein [Candidatus Lokiarchaeota archaeon]|jgi:hypothetical protein